MKLPVPRARLIENVSTERDKTLLANQVRDAVLNQQVNAFANTATSDATPADAWSDDVPSGGVVDLLLIAVAAGDAGNQGAFRRRVVASRVGMAAVVILGQDVIGTDQKTDPSWDVNFTVDAGAPTALFATVTGGAENVTWRLSIAGIAVPWA